VDVTVWVKNRLVATHEFLQRCVADLTDEEGGRVIAGRLTPAVWQIGHLALVDADYVQRGGGTHVLPVTYHDLFHRGGEVRGAYPPLRDVWTTFEGVHRALVEVAGKADYTGPTEGRAYATVGEMLIQACVHRGYHVGKLTTLRTLLGKPRMFG